MTGRKSRRPVTADEIALFSRVMAEARPLKNRKPRKLSDAEKADRPVLRDADLPPPKPQAAVPAPSPSRAPQAHTRLRPEGSAAAPEPAWRPAEPRRSSLSGLDKRNATRLSRGKIEIEARLDLHGQTQEGAHRALRHFITAQFSAGRRCVLVITGKGSKKIGGAGSHAGDGAGFMPDRRRGVLHRLVPLWLREPELAGFVVAFHPARPRHGGDGALYVYLRRQRPRD